MSLFLPYLDQDDWCSCVLSASTTTASFAVWLLPACFQASALFRRLSLLLLRLVRQVLKLKAYFHMRCLAWQPKVYPVPGAREQMSLCACLCSSKGCLLTLVGPVKAL